MKKLLIASVIFSVMGVAQGYAQDLDRPQDKFADFTAKMNSSKAAISVEDLRANLLRAQTTDELQAALEAQSKNLGQAAYPSDKKEEKAVDPFANMIIADSEIKAVTVYNNRAKVTRVAEIAIPAGAHTVAFKGLPENLLPDSLRAEGSAAAIVKLGSIAHKQIMEAKLSSPREQEVFDRLQSLFDQKSGIATETAALADQEAFLKNISKETIAHHNENRVEFDLKPDQWSAAAQVLRSNLADIYKARLQLSLKTRDLDAEINKLQREFRQVDTRQRSVFTVLVPLEAERDTKLNIEISYQVPNATWMPIYDARMNTDGKSDLKLVQYGSVRQQTGEDWKGVTLTLSTAQPQRGASLPDLGPMWVNGWPRDTSSAFFGSISNGNLSRVGGDTAGAKQTVGAEVNDPEYVRKLQEQRIRLTGDPIAEWRAKSEAKAVAIEFIPAQINTGGFMSEYKIAGPANVPSDGSETKLLVGKFDVESKLQVHIKPQMSTDAYLVVHGKLKGETPILPGQVSLFRDEAYVGQSTLPLLRPDEEYDLYFGIDDQIAVKRKVVIDQQKEEGVIGKRKILERSYITEMQNLHDIAVDIVVKETTPAPQTDKIEVAINTQLTTPGYTSDADNIKGLLNWEFKMEPKEKKDLKLDWTVSWPSDFTISGL
ncbi:MAG: mucoidy inhibitor MuiA family protein [Alphaproteobacteria bacterium]